MIAEFINPQSMPNASWTDALQPPLAASSAPPPRARCWSDCPPPPRIGAATRRSELPPGRFQLRYILASAMYGTGPLAEILAEVRKTGADAIDLWPRVHGNQREQVEAMGEQAFLELLSRNQVRLGALTQYRLGPFGLAKRCVLPPGWVDRAPF